MLNEPRLLLERALAPETAGNYHRNYRAVHDVTLLREESVTEIRGPLNIVRETFHKIRKRRHGINAWIPRLFLHRWRWLHR